MPTPTWVSWTRPATDLDALMRDDEEIAERIDEEKASYDAEMAARRAEVDAAIGDAEG